MESSANDGYSGFDDVTKVCQFFQGIRSIEMEGAVYAIQAQPEKYG